ncbi:MAG: zf-HC2 domain-containing protein [Actinomycetota bacterium]|nr:zf-HC2 domain-containing protein [Actinomycetota bacterium]
MDHLHCSELLLPYAMGELREEERREVESHLDVCADCRSELAAVEAVRSNETPPMSDLERKRLHRAVARSVTPREPVILGAGLGKRSQLARRFGPTIAAAALLVVVAVLGVSGIGQDGGGEEASTAAGGAQSERSSGRKVEGRADETQEKASGAAPEAAAEPGEETVDGEGISRSGSAPRPEFRHREANSLDAADYTVDDDRLLLDYQKAYTAADAKEREARFISLLSKDAPGGLRDQVEQCGREVREATEQPVLAAYGARAGRKSQDGLLLSFVYPASSRGPLSRYMVWTWPVGSCAQRLSFTSGALQD